MRPDLQNELSLHRLELIYQRLQLTLAVAFEVPEPLGAGLRCPAPPRGTGGQLDHGSLQVRRHQRRPEHPLRDGPELGLARTIVSSSLRLRATDSIFGRRFALETEFGAVEHENQVHILLRGLIPM